MGTAADNPSTNENFGEDSDVRIWQKLKHISVEIRPRKIMIILNLQELEPKYTVLCILDQTIC